MSENRNAHTETNTKEPNKNLGQSSSESKISPEAEYGYYYYPERKEKHTWNFWKNLNIFDRYTRHHEKCWKNMEKGLENPHVKVLVQALKAHGCEILPRRHIVCEECIYPVQGGFDPKANQVVVCQNMCKSEKRVTSVIGHELTHMFDYCRAKVDYKNLDHLACTEIRAASFFHCGYMGAWMQGDVTMWTYDKGHQTCVKKKAVESILAVRAISRGEAYDVVNRVFDRCYNDLEPFGRRVMSQTDAKLSLAEGRLFGHKLDPAGEADTNRDTQSMPNS